MQRLFHFPHRRPPMFRETIERAKLGQRAQFFF